MDNFSLEADKSIAYGAIYLDDGEDPQEFTKNQIESFREQLPKFVFFDVICNPKQIAEAIATRGYVEQELFHELDMGFVQLYVAIGFSENDRPARKAMMEYMT